MTSNGMQSAIVPTDMASTNDMQSLITPTNMQSTVVPTNMQSTVVPTNMQPTVTPTNMQPTVMPTKMESTIMPGTTDKINTCNPAAGNIMMSLNELYQQLMSPQLSSETKIELLLSDPYYTRINQLVNMISEMNTDTYKCMVDNNNSSVCANDYNVDIDKMISVVDKYNPVIKKLFESIHKLSVDAQSRCNGKGDVNKIRKLRSVMSKLGLLLIDQENLVNVCSYVNSTNPAIGVGTTNGVSTTGDVMANEVMASSSTSRNAWIIIIVVFGVAVLLFIGWLLWRRSKNKPETKIPSNQLIGTL
jgi:hypothetical protein